MRRNSEPDEIEDNNQCHLEEDSLWVKFAQNSSQKLFLNPDITSESSDTLKVNIQADYLDCYSLSMEE